MRKSCSLHLWDSNNEEASHDLLNPYRTAEENNKFKEAITLELCYVNTFGCTVVFPEDQQPVRHQLSPLTAEELRWSAGQGCRNGRRKTYVTFFDELKRIADR